MLILAVDDEKMQLSRLCRSIEENCPDAEIVRFENPRKAMEWVEANRPDVAFLDIEMPEISGTMLAKAIKTRYPDANIVFVTAFPEYAGQAFELHASGYVTKPANPQKIALELANLRYPIPLPRNDDKLEVVCFGDFDVLWHGAPLSFKRQKTLELFAFLVDRHGAHANVNEICFALWEDSDDDTKNKSYLRHLVTDLRSTLESIGQSHVFRSERNSYSIDPDAIDCDYFDYLDDKAPAIRSFGGKYMTRYSWAEETLASLLDEELY